MDQKLHLSLPQKSKLGITKRHNLLPELLKFIIPYFSILFDLVFEEFNQYLWFLLNVESSKVHTEKSRKNTFIEI